MRLQLITAVMLAPAIASAQSVVEDTDSGDGKVTGAIGMYADSDKTTVTTSTVDGRVHLPAPVVVQAHALVDAVSSASVDVVSAATPRFTENRIELGTSATARVASTDLTLSYTHSAENDWLSHSFTGSVSRDLAHKNAKLTLAYGFTRNHVGRSGDPNFEKLLDVQGGELGFSQILDRKTLASLSYTLSHASGYQGSPYRFIMSAGVTAPETTPQTRTRHALTARVLRVIAHHSTLDASYRLYVDDWGILSHTAEVAWIQEITEALELRVRARGYRQTHADFYRETYDMPMRYMTVDRELSTFWDAAGGVKLGWRGEHFEIDGKVDALVYRFEDYARLRGRAALVTGVGVSWQW